MFIYFVLYFLIFMLGASLASYAGVLVYRENIKDRPHPQLKKLLFLSNREGGMQRSVCDICDRNLKFYNLIPIFSSLYFCFFKTICCKSIANKANFRKYFTSEFLSGLFLITLFYNIFAFNFLDNFYNNNIYIVLFLIKFLFINIFVFYFILLSLQDLKDKAVSAKYLFQFLFFSILTFLFYFILNKFYLQINILENIFNFNNIFVNILYIFLPSIILFLIYILSRARAIGLADPLFFFALSLFNFAIFKNDTNILFDINMNIFLYANYFGVLFILIFYIYNKFKKDNNVKNSKNIKTEEKYIIKSLPFIPLFCIANIFLLITNLYIIKYSDIIFLYETLLF